MDNRDWRNQPLTWSLLRTQFSAWFSRHRVALSIALVVAIIIWGVCKGIAEGGNIRIPAGAQIVQITDYAHAYDVYKDGEKLILERVRDDGIFVIVMSGFGIAWWVVYLIQEYKSDRKQSGFSKVSFTLMNGLFGLILAFLVYQETYPSIVVLSQPQFIVLDPRQDLVTLNGKPLGRLSSIAEFEGIHKSGYRYDWSWFGVKLTDGRYYSFTEGSLVGGNVELIAPYVNRYLKQKRLNAAVEANH